MATRRKRRKSKAKRISFKPGTLKRRKRQKESRLGPSLISTLKVLSVVCVFLAAGVLLYFAEKYVKSAKPVETGPVELVDVPEWVSGQLKTRILAVAGGETLGLDENAAHLVAENLASAAWLDEVRVQTTDKSIQVRTKFRKPIALVKSGLLKFYVDAEQVVLDFVPIPNLPIVNIKGLSAITRTPPLGRVWQRNDLAAAVKILDQLGQMDKSLMPEKALLYEIDSIDVSNFNGRENIRRPHIILYAKDNTEIIWGAEVGKWQQHLESTDEQKLAKLYGYYKDYGTLSGGAKYINLCDPRDKVPLPIDKY